MKISALDDILSSVRIAHWLFRLSNNNLEDENFKSQAKGSDPDIIVASAKAYINALNKLIYKKSKKIPEHISELKVKGV